MDTKDLYLFETSCGGSRLVKTEDCVKFTRSTNKMKLLKFVSLLLNEQQQPSSTF